MWKMQLYHRYDKPSSETNYLGSPIDSVIFMLKEGGDMVEFFKAMVQFYQKSQEPDDVSIAAYELALLNAQLGLFDKVDTYLSHLGFKFRLANDIFCRKDLWVGGKGACPSGIASLFDNAIPHQLFQQLVSAFQATSPFWEEHDYANNNSFFSYNLPLVGLKETFPCLITQVAKQLQPLLERAFPKRMLGSRKQSLTTSVEWWCHSRSPSEAHQLHFDLDEEALKRRATAKTSVQHTGRSRGSSQKRDLKKNFSGSGGSICDIHPLVSVVLYLDCGSGALTLVTDQVGHGLHPCECVSLHSLHLLVVCVARLGAMSV